MTTWKPPTERLEFADGAWWEFRAVVTRGMRKAFRRAAATALIATMADGTGVDFTVPEQLRQYILAHPDGVNVNAVDDAYLLHGTVAWSFDAPVTMESIDALPDSCTHAVLSRMAELYGELAEETLKK